VITSGTWRQFIGAVSIFALIASLAPQAGKAAGAPTQEYEYPELLVTPRASERLDMEAKTEADSRWTRHLPVQASALATLAAGIIQTGGKDPAKDTQGYSPLAGIVVGGVWLGTTLALSALHHPYTTSAEAIKGQPKATKRDQLARERYAEESLEQAARLGRRLTLLSVISNLGANAYMMLNAQSGSLAFVADGVAGVLSLAPLLFSYRWQTVECEQQEYKKKIYGPVASGTVFMDRTTQKPIPGVALSLAF
jgi:hypothetical protein